LHKLDKLHTTVDIYLKDSKLINSRYTCYDVDRQIDNGSGIY